MRDAIENWKRQIRGWLTRQPRTALAGGAVFLLAAAWFLYVPPCGAAQKARAECLRLQADLSDCYRTIQPARSGETPLLPEAGSFHQVLEQLNSMARSHQVQLAEVSPGTARPGSSAGLTVIPVDLRVEGEYRALGEFLGGLTQGPSLGVVSVRQLSLDRQEQILPRLRGRVSLEILLREVSDAPPA